MCMVFCSENGWRYHQWKWLVSWLGFTACQPIGLFLCRFYLWTHVLVYLTHRWDPNRCYHSGSEWSWGVMAMKGFTPHSPGLQKPRHQMQFNVIPRTLNEKWLEVPINEKNGWRYLQWKKMVGGTFNEKNGWRYLQWKKWLEVPSMKNYLDFFFLVLWSLDDEPCLTQLTPPPQKKKGHPCLI